MTVKRSKVMWTVGTAPVSYHSYGPGDPDTVVPESVDPLFRSPGSQESTRRVFSEWYYPSWVLPRGLPTEDLLFLE